MNVPIYTDDKAIFKSVKSAFGRASTRLTISQVQYKESAMIHLESALPFLSIVDAISFGVDFDTFIGNATQNLMSDRKVMILILREAEYKDHKRYLRRYPFIISVLKAEEIEERLGGLLSLFSANPHILINLEMQALTSTSITSRFALSDIYRAVPFVCQGILRLIARLGLIEADSIESTHLTLLELLSNAIEHGNFEISFDDKHNWLTEHHDIYSLIEQKRSDPKFKNRYSTLEMNIFPTHIHFQITDMGKGFDWRSFKKSIADTTQKAPAQHGYGIAMASKYASNITYNDKGNVVSFDILLDENRIRSTFPKYFVRNNPRITLNEGELLADESVEYLTEYKDYKVYLIVDGELKLFRGERQVGVVFADDIFCGELDYLLQTRHSATIIASTPARFISLTAEEFVHLMGTADFCKPLITRILAERLERAYAGIGMAT